MKVGNVLSPSTTVPLDSIVLISLSGGEGQNRISVNDSVTLADLGVDPTSMSSLKKPEFPKDQIDQVNSETSIDPATRVTMITEILSAYEQAVEKYSQSGGASLTDLIVQKVYDYLVDKHGFSREDTGSDAKLIREDELQCTAIPHANGFVFSVTGTSYWG